MADTTPQVVRGYLAELDAALAEVPAGVRGEIVAGVREELSGLDAATAAVRIEELGDPAFIAAEARAEVGVDVSVAPTQASGEAGWFAVLAGLLVAVGGVIIPLIGWVVGIALVWVSRAWFRWEKVVATLAAPAAIVVVGGLLWLFSIPTSAMEGGANPILPTPLDFAHSLILFGGLVNLGVGIWLLWRAKRTPRPSR